MYQICLIKTGAESPSSTISKASTLNRLFSSYSSVLGIIEIQLLFHKMATAVLKEEPEPNEIQILDPSNFHIELLNPSELTSADQIINIKLEPPSDADQMGECDPIDSQPVSKKIKSEYPESDQIYVIDMNDTRYKIIIVKEEANVEGTETFPGTTNEPLDSVSNNNASHSDEKIVQNKVSVGKIFLNVLPKIMT